MVFECVNGTRPVRLCEKTRQFAYDSLHHKYGKDTLNVTSVEMDYVEGFTGLPPIDQYDLGITEIAKKAPVRICKDERISGAATLGMAMEHYLPYTVGGKKLCMSVSHLTLDFETVLKKGINGIAKDIEDSLSVQTDPDKIRFLESCRNVISALRIWHSRYLEALEGRDGYAANYNNLLRVPFEPARNFYEAVQSIWFVFAFVRLCGNWPGIGRIDLMLGDYLKNDLAASELTIEEAREILAHFFIKGCEWIKGGDCGSGDAQHYQNIVISGTGGDGKDITNEVTYLVLDIIEELGISDFPTSVRLNSGTDEKFLLRVAEVLKLGGGVLAFYNEETVIRSLVGFGYSKDEAWKFANDGCWEIQIPGKTFFAYIPFDSLAVLQHKTLKNYDPSCSYNSFEELYSRFRSDLKDCVEEIIVPQNNILKEDKPGKSMKWPKDAPCTVVSVFEQGCIEKGVSYFEGGPVYNVISPHIGGYPDTMNSLYAIKKIVFDEKKLSFADFMKVLKEDWNGSEDLRMYIKNHYDWFGNDNDEVDEIGKRIIDDLAGICAPYDNMRGYLFPCGVSTFGRQLEWAPYRLASAHGYHAGDVLAPNCSPTPGTDREGATAVIRSYCKADLKKTVTGAALDLKLLPESVNGSDGTDAVIGLLRGFVSLGGSFIQPDVADREILKAAQLHPEDYQTLSVRVSGWNARFVTLNKEWQDMVIDENK